MGVEFASEPPRVDSVVSHEHTNMGMDVQQSQPEGAALRFRRTFERPGGATSRNS